MQINNVYKFNFVEERKWLAFMYLKVCKTRKNSKPLHLVLKHRYNNIQMFYSSRFSLTKS